MKLTNRDKLQMAVEIVATILLLLLFNLAVILGIDIAVKSNPLLNLGLVTLRSAFFTTKPIRPGTLKFPQGFYLRWWVIFH